MYLVWLKQQFLPLVPFKSNSIPLFSKILIPQYLFTARFLKKALWR